MKMKWLKRLMKRVPSNTTLQRFDSKNMRIEWVEGNRLKFSFLKSCYIPKGDTMTVNVTFNTLKVEPGVIYGTEINTKR